MQNEKCKLNNSGIFNFQFSIFNSRRDGFTLLEVMIAIAIIGGLLVTLIYTLNYHLGIAERHEFLTVASLLAKDKIYEMEKKPARGKGDFPGPYADYHYITDIRESPYQGMSEISVIVSNGKEDVQFTELIQNAK
ncbi:MAG: type II secretion system GspH family protein [Nitrospirae bacterium]|nr:type II secretion system GspH family protein [Nitrospirota bacterium]